MKRIIIAVLCTLTAALLFPAQALAASPPYISDKAANAEDDNRLTECSRMAKDAKLTRWFCVGGNVYDHTGERKSNNPVQRQRERRSVGPVADDWDWWCEDQAICDRQITDYIMETKANYEWGVIDSNGNYTRHGGFDAVIRINLDGRRARFTQTLIWDDGPNLYFPRVWANCYEEIDLLPDNSCGEYTTGNGAFIHSGSWRWDSGTNATAWLVNSNEYYLQYNAEMRPAGFETLRLPYFETPYFYCYGGNESYCYFPS